MACELQAVINKIKEKDMENENISRARDEFMEYIQTTWIDGGTAPTCGLVSGEGVTTQTMLKRRTTPSLTGTVQYGIAEYSRQLTENIPNWVYYPQLVI